MSLVVDVRISLNDLISEGWDPLFEEVKVFCMEVGIDIPDMNGTIPRFCQLRREGKTISLKIIFTIFISSMMLLTLIAELDHRFNEVSSELLTCFACLDSREIHSTSLM
jgi:hypothetical protein